MRTIPTPEPHRRRTDPRTEAEKQKISDSRRRTALKLQGRNYREAELMFRLLLERGITTTDEAAVALALLDRAISNPDLEGGRRRSLLMYRDAVERGNRIKVAVYTFTDDGPPDDGEGIIPRLIAQIAACL